MFSDTGQYSVSVEKRKSESDLSQGKVSENIEMPASSEFKNLFLVSLNSRINGPSFRNAFSVQRERKRQLDYYPGIIHPFSNFRF